MSRRKFWSPNDSVVGYEETNALGRGKFVRRAIDPIGNDLTAFGRIDLAFSGIKGEKEIQK